jgi:phosphatidylinositol alpha-1,6-mannosyltransferase|tara:strand:- start:6472 stop:7608 length:1137 start_codon:yes stop_codon:yes gene_type:complete
MQTFKFNDIKIIFKSRNLMKYIIITQTFPPRTGGMQTVMTAIAKRLSTLEKTIVFPDHFVSKDNDISKENFSIYNNFTPKLFRSFVKKLLAYQTIENEDIIICDSWKSINAVPNIANKIIVLAHGQEYLSSNKKYDLIKKSLRRANHIICSSKYTYDLIESLKITDTNKSIIPPTYSLEKINKRLEIKTFKSSNKVHIISITRLEERKGIIPVLKSLGALKKSKSLKPFIWDIFGIGDQKDEIEEVIKALNLAQYVKLKGAITNKDKEYYLSIADLFIMPSYKVEKSIEGFGISYVEAAAYSIPSIAGQEGGVTDAVLDKKTGWCVNPMNQKQLSKVLLEAINNNKKRELLGRQAQEEFLNSFVGEKVFRKFMKSIHS